MGLNIQKRLSWRALFYLLAIDGDIECVIAHCNQKKATGCDGISVRLLQLCSPMVSESLLMFFNRTFKTGQIPQEWKKSRITPIGKNEHNTLPAHSRPIFVINKTAKIVEKIVLKQLERHFENYHIPQPKVDSDVVTLQNGNFTYSFKKKAKRLTGVS